MITTTTRSRAVAALISAIAVVAASLAVLVVSPAPANATSCYGTYLSVGSSGTCVKVLQRKIGYLSVDGSYGDRTAKRVRAFQRDTGLGVDGKVGPATWSKIKRYGKALGWKNGVTFYMCKVDATYIRNSVWNNSGKTIAWEFLAENRRFYATSGIADDRIARYTRTRHPKSASSDAKHFAIWFNRFNDYRKTTNVRNFPRHSLPLCG